MQTRFGELKNLARAVRAAVRRFWRRLTLRVKANQKPRRIVLGSSGLPVPGWLLTDIDQLNVVVEKDWRRYFAHDSLNTVLAEHVWEHLTYDEGRKAAALCYRFLRPGGRLRIAVPDGRHPDPDYINAVKPMGTAEGSDDHKVLYTAASLRLLLESVGFNVRVLECFDEKGHFFSADWDPEDGMIRRSARFDSRNGDGVLCYTSIVMDAFKPSA